MIWALIQETVLIALPGFAAAVLEMLIQYEGDKIFLLPALPDEWTDGEISGLKAPGGITIGFKWKNKCVTEISLNSICRTECMILYNGCEEKIVLNAEEIQI